MMSEKIALPLPRSEAQDRCFWWHCVRFACLLIRAREFDAATKPLAMLVILDAWAIIGSVDACRDGFRGLVLLMSCSVSCSTEVYSLPIHSWIGLQSYQKYIINVHYFFEASRLAFCHLYLAQRRSGNRHHLDVAKAMACNLAVASRADWADWGDWGDWDEWEIWTIRRVRTIRTGRRPSFVHFACRSQ